LKGEFRYGSDVTAFLLLGLYYTAIIMLVVAEVILWVNTAHSVEAWIDMPFLLAFVLLGIIPFFELIAVTIVLLGVMLPAIVSENT